MQSAGLYCCYARVNKSRDFFLHPKGLSTDSSKHQKFKRKMLASLQRKVRFETSKKELADIKMMKQSLPWK